MSSNGPGSKLQMVYKLTTYVLIAFGGAISGALIGLFTGPLNIHLSVDNPGTMGACLGACLASAVCRFAIEHHEAAERNRELLRAVEGRLARVLGNQKPELLDG
jgi:hypothetical protein